MVNNAVAAGHAQHHARIRLQGSTPMQVITKAARYPWAAIGMEFKHQLA